MNPEPVLQSEADHKDHEQHENHDEHSLQYHEQYTKEQMKSIVIRGWICILGCIFMNLVIGCFYLFGGISPYVAAYLKAQDSTVSLTTMAMVFPVLGLITMGCLSFGVKLAEKIGYRLVMFLSGVFISISYFINSFHANYIAFIIIFCIFVGIASGLSYMLPILCGWKYFPLNKGRISGIIIAALGFGAFIMNFVCQAYVNPDNKKPSIVYIDDGVEQKYFDETIYDKVPNMFRILGAQYQLP